MKHTLILSILLIFFTPNSFFAGEYQKCKIVYESGEELNCEIYVHRTDVFASRNVVKCIVNGKKIKVDLHEVSQIEFETITYIRYPNAHIGKKATAFFLTKVDSGLLDVYIHYSSYQGSLGTSYYFTQGEFKDSELEQFYNPREDIRTYFKDICPVIHEKLQDDGYWIQSLRNLQNLFEDVNDACK